MTEPVLVGLLFADRIITEKNDKRGIIGTFSRFNSPRFPVAFPPWYIYAAVTNLSKREHEFALNLVCDATNQVIVPLSGKISVEDPSNIVEITPMIAGAVFPQAGKYSLTFYIDGNQVGARNIEVKLLKQAGG